MTITSLVIVDANLGNIGSVASAVERLGIKYQIAKTPFEIKEKSDTTHIILPGVGTFKMGMESLREAGWCGWIHENSKCISLLGICLGMQLLADQGYEGLNEEDEKPVEGLGLIKGSINRIERSQSNLTIPHVGWNNVEWKQRNSKIAEGIEDNSDFYFVHSFEFKAKNKDNILATTEYAEDIVAVVGKEKILGVQFHPEKSQKAGSMILKNFLTL